MIATPIQEQQVSTEARVNELAGREVSRWIEQAEWDALAAKEKQTVLLAMEDRGMVLFPRDGKLFVVEKDVAASPIEFHPVEAEYEFGINSIDDPRIACSGDVTFKVFNCRDRQHAWAKLCRFLKSIQKAELDLQSPIEDHEE